MSTFKLVRKIRQRLRLPILHIVRALLLLLNSTSHERGTDLPSTRAYISHRPLYFMVCAPIIWARWRTGSRRL